MSLLSGINHVAIVTADLDRFIEFYGRIFGASVVFRENDPFRHAILRIGPDSWLHPVEALDNPNATASSRMFHRGHVDHVALTASSRAAFGELRKRLIECGASEGAIDDLGAFRTLAFQDPDGMRGELTWVVDPALAGIHEPRALAEKDVSAGACEESVVR